MTVKDLSRLYWLNREIESNQRQLDALKSDIDAGIERLAELRAASQACSAPNMSGMPHGSGVGNPVENAVMRIVGLEQTIKRNQDLRLELEAIISARQTLCLLERKRLGDYIDGIESEQLRQIFTLRFIDGLPWSQVSACIGGGNTDDSVKKACYRYLRKSEEKQKSPVKSKVVPNVP